jgi:hypothetical protein
LEGQSAAAVLERSGWARSVGGSGPYLTLFSRGHVSRADADAAAAHVEIHELPSARGCTYVVPRRDYTLALRSGQPYAGAPMKVAAKLGVTEKEIDKLQEAVKKALAKGAMDPDQIREATGDASRSLGPEGVKKGVSTTLPLALGLLQAAGEIRRVPVNGRLDQQRYKYTLWKPNPLAGNKMSEAETFTEMARLYFRWIGPATTAEFQWFSGLGVKAAKAAVEPLGLVPLEAGSEMLLFADDAKTLAKFSAPKKPDVRLVSALDAMFLHRRNVASLLDDAARESKVYTEKGLQALGGLSELSSNAILDRGRLVGLWEFDPDSGTIAWSSYGAKTKEMAAAVAETEAFVREELGDARSFSLDSPKSRVPRIKALRASG